MDRQVKGIWIPIEIWNADGISWNEKILLMEIDSFSSKRKPCFISNEYIGKMFGVSEVTASKYMNRLISLGYVVVEKFDGRTRYVRSTLADNFKADIKETLRQTTQELNATYNKNTYKSSINIEDNSKPKSFPFKNALIEIGVSKEVAEAWMQVRKNKRATNTEIAFKAIKKEINKSGLTPEQAIQVAVENSWSGFKAEWTFNRKANSAPHKESALEHNMRLADEMFGTNYHQQAYGVKEVYDEQ